MRLEQGADVMNDLEASGSDSQSLDISWIIKNLLENSLAGMDLQQQFETTCTQLHAAGVGLSRAHMSVNTLHPQFRAMSHTWYLSEEMRTQYYDYSYDSDDWRQSPLYHMINNRVVEIRRHLTGPEAMLDFPVLKTFAAQGFTDYRGYMAGFMAFDSMPENPEGLAGSWCTSVPNGFTRLRLGALREVELALAVVCKMHMKQQMTDNILKTYLGSDAGQQVRSGRIRRGDVESVDAVIWYSDMRGSTELAAKLTGREFLASINDYFSCTADAILEHGGEVLRFIGDAVLAIFPVRSLEQTEAAFSNAQSALIAARENMNKVNQERVDNGHESLQFGLALHYGEVLFGNIGSAERLEFSVVGTAANEVARIEEMTKHLGYTTLVSEQAAKHLSLRLEDLGEQLVRGSETSLRVFGVSI